MNEQQSISKDILEELSHGETLEVEFKNDNKDFSDTLIIKAAVALANAEGGRIYVGVKNNGKIVGSKRLSEEYWKNESAIEGMILSNTTPSHGTKVSVLAHGE